jgi:phosphoribosylformimino-5-aminoimidazole carboxamide ribotide isomerase
VQIVPSIDLQTGRSRLVMWPGAATGEGSPTDRPEKIAEHFVALGARMLHLVDLDGAARGAPVNTDAVQRISRAVAVPIQLAGGLDGPEQIELAFAAGATRVVVPLWIVAEDVSVLRACLRVASDWLAVGVDPRPDRLAAYPWHGAPPSFDSLVGMLAAEGVRRVVVSHWSVDNVEDVARAIRAHDLDLQLAGGATDAAGVDAARAAGADALILGEALFSGAIDFATTAEGVPING